jgi:hypothetical protein
MGLVSNDCRTNLTVCASITIDTSSSFVLCHHVSLSRPLLNGDVGPCLTHLTGLGAFTAINPSSSINHLY